MHTCRTLVYRYRDSPQTGLSVTSNDSFTIANPSLIHSRANNLKIRNGRHKMDPEHAFAWSQSGRIPLYISRNKTTTKLVLV